MKRGLVLLVLLVACLAPVGTASADVGFNVTTLEPAGTSVRDVAVGDLDGKNGPDIVTSYYEGGISVNLNNGNGTFGPAHLYPTGCDTAEVELADVGSTSYGLAPDGNLDAVVVCVYGGGNSQYLGRIAGDGTGGFVEPQIVPELNFGPFNQGNPQEMALADVRGPGLAPVPVFTYLTQDPFHEPTFYRVLCFTYDWATKDCLTRESAQTSAPLVAGVVADARIFGLGSAQGLIDWGPYPEWHSSTRDLAPTQPSTTNENFKSITIGDLAGDGPDIISASGSCGCGFQDVPAAGVVDVSYGNLAQGVPEQVGTQFPSAPGVTNIATGDFDLDGHTDLIGNSWSYDPATATSTGAVFVQSGNGAGALGAPQMIPLSHTEAFSRAPIRVADLDRNGAPDAVAIVGGKVQVLINQKTPPPPAPAPVAHPIIGKASTPLAGLSGLPKTTRPDKKGNLLLGTATNPPTASVELTITLPPTKKGKGKGNAIAAAAKPKKGKPKGVVIGHSLTKIATGKKVALKVHLGKAALAKLKQGPLKATLAIVAVGSAGNKEATSQSLTIKPAKAKKKHKA
jgi:hypothetical protein